jgi:hypothetical protein
MQETPMRGIVQTRHELISKSRDNFQGFVFSLLGELLEGSAETRRLGLYDKKGIDILVYRPDDLSIQTAIQCKGFEEIEYGKSQQLQCREEVAKFKEKGPRVIEYWLVLNRPIKERAARNELLDDLSNLVLAGKADRTFLFDLDPFLQKIKKLASVRLANWAEAKRAELYDYYGSRLRFVEYVRDIPFQSVTPKMDLVGHILDQLRTFFKNLPKTQAGKFRPAPKILMTSSFGFGKTSTLHALAREWIHESGQLIYAPAALLEADAFSNSSRLAAVLLDFLLPDGAELTELGHKLLRDTLSETFAKSTNWILLIDGLDENAALLKAESLSRIRDCIRDLGVPAILSARDELVDIRTTEFSSSLRVQPTLPLDRIRLLDWPDRLILHFLERFEAGHAGACPLGFQTLKELVRSGRYAEIYGDIPKRPLFLGMLAEDAWSGGEPTRELHRLYGKYFREKFLLDRYSAAAGGISRRPSHMVDHFGIDEALERLILVMQDSAGLMISYVQIDGQSDKLILIQHDTISEDRLRGVATNRGIEFIQLEDVVLHSLLQPGGRNLVTRQRLLRFAHRSFQDWFLARHLVLSAERRSAVLPDSVSRFMTAMQLDIDNGVALP